jgi:hypothetical protein
MVGTTPKKGESLMTYSRREEIFSKDYLTISDIQELLGMTYQCAAELIRTVKRALTFSPKYNGQGVRLDIQGKLHVEDYMDYFRVKCVDRYFKHVEKEEKEEGGVA